MGLDKAIEFAEDEVETFGVPYCDFKVFYLPDFKQRPLDKFKRAVRKAIKINKQKIKTGDVLDLVKEMLMNEGQRRIQVMTELLTKAQEAGEVRPELDPARLAQQLMVGLAGAAALVKGLITTEEVMHLLESMIDLWT